MEYSKRSSRRKKQIAALHHINVTPLVDVMLVLLIIFMVSAPMLTVNIPVNLPKTAGKASEASGKEEPLVIMANKKGSLFFQETEVGLEELVNRLNIIFSRNPDIKIYLKADKNLFYGKVMELMGRLSASGLKKISLITEAQS